MHISHLLLMPKFSKIWSLLYCNGYKTWHTFMYLCTILILILDFFTLLLYKCSHQSVKLGYYQLRFVLGYLVVYDAITKNTAWKWDISHICGYSFEKTSAVRIEIGRYLHVSKHNVFIYRHTLQLHTMLFYYAW